MKLPINCPICNHIMIYSSYQIKKEPYSVYDEKKCINDLDHRLYFTSSIKEDNVFKIQYFMRSGSDYHNIVWDLDNNTLVIKNTANDSKINLPWIEPDFSNYKKIIKKLKIYILFS